MMEKLYLLHGTGDGLTFLDWYSLNVSVNVIYDRYINIFIDSIIQKVSHNSFVRVRRSGICSRRFLGKHIGASVAGCGVCSKNWPGISNNKYNL